MDLIANFVAYAKQQVRTFHNALEQALGCGDDDAIHDLRVASRRVQEPLALMELWLDRRAVKRSRAMLRRARRAFRKVRDLDVLLLALRDAPPKDILAAETLAELEGILTRQRERTFKAAQHACHRLKPTRETRRIEDLFQTVAGLAAGQDATLDKQLARLLHDRASALLALDPRHADATDLHAVRIRLKQFRYACNLKQKVEGREADGLHAQLVDMQRLLGHWNDQVYAARKIGGLARRCRRLSARAGFSAALFDLAARCARDAEGDERRILEMWAGLDAAIREAVATPGHLPENAEYARTAAGS